MWSIRIQYRDKGVVKQVQISHANDDMRSVIMSIADDKIVKDGCEIIAIRMVRIHGN